MSKSLVSRYLASIVQRGTLDVSFADGTKRVFGSPAEGFPDVAVIFTDAKVPRDIMLDPRLGAAEAFMDGRLTLKRGGIMELVELLRSNAPWDRGGSIGNPRLVRRVTNRLAFAREGINGRLGAQRNVAHHYDIGNDLYRLMLDCEHMQYSCAYWADGVSTLGEAQEAKLAHIAAKLALKDGQTVLDIGCGWGGMAIYLARRFGVTVTGITLSKEQLALAMERAEEAGVAERVQFELADYRDLPASGRRFDRIVSVGMFEHVGRPQFDTFFKTCANLLADTGVMLLHTIGRIGSPGTTDAFTRKYIFPGGYIPALSETVAASEKYRLIATDTEMLRLHYAKTLRAWYANCMVHREAIEAMYDERFFRMWTFYLAGAAASFEYGGMCNCQIQYTRDRRALPFTRDYMTQAETELGTPA
ncbi:Cyclopropane-fatty-acyl-phospholipid synthase [Alteripontixanthobacter maritimus]|uniref:Cyclopropane-fatty-acyl-phospholipid synthase n=1 Tax=Alteripontixanthobacter maritimus TaxID=2161824 RepID=A0A369QCJ8_9SPHN|nr:cyclopropane-fatty-acyl-phospholipid synthase family protein [Alteripontixanthobacter maritimus]RDC60967.1 Cyclopropane-fatty-acyl-phospholipid synthase [Alteripontixanthobacter maritimus]